MAIRRICEFLDGNKAKYVLISHSPAYTAQEVAASAHVSGTELAKTVIVKIDGKLAMAVVPANREVDMGALRDAANAQYAELADKSEFIDRFEGCQVGMMPPFGNLFGMETYVERELAKLEQIVFNAGTHTNAIAMKFLDYRRLVHPHLVKIAMQSPSPQSKVLQI